jgi:diguanylate cyclase (GGDEF)-like protein/PAS domain S-box-containing protein
LAPDDADVDSQGAATGDVASVNAALREQQQLAVELRAELDDYRLLVENSQDLVVKVDLRGRFLFVSPSYCALFDCDQEHLLGKTFMPRVHEEDRSATARAMEKVFTPPHESYLEQRAMTRSGWRWLAWSEKGLLNNAGQVVAIVAVGRDITDRKLAELALRESEVRYRQLFENMSDGVAMYEVIGGGEDFIFLEINRAAENILRIDRSAVIGKPVIKMFPGIEDLGLADVFRRVWKTGESEYHPTRHYRDDRIALWVDNFVMKLANGEIVTIFEDLSAQKKAEQRLLQSEKRLRDSQAYAHLGFWELRSDGKGALWSDEIYRIAGINPDTKAGPDTLRQLVHPDDVEDVMASLQRSLDTGEEHHIEYRLLRPDGRQRWVECRARPNTQGDGPPEKLVGFLQDITERKSIELALRQSEQRFDLAMRGANDGVFDWDLESGEIYFSPRWKSMLGYADDELPNTRETWKQLIVPEQRDDVLAMLDAYRAGQRDNFEIEYQMRHREGHPVDILARAHVMKNAQGESKRVVGTHADMTARKQAEKEIQHLAFHDSLTGLPNRLLFGEALEQMLATYKRDGQQFAVHLLDLDHFKEVNDNLGHPVGDQLLQAVARRISALVRTSDLFARLGGDEFVLIQHGIEDPAETSVLAAKIISAVDKVFEIAENRIHTSVSIGIVIPHSAEIDGSRLMSYADVAMYKAKGMGRGTYAFFEDAMTDQLQREMRLCDQLRHAAVEGELFLLYQPKYELGSGRLVGLEALLRWNHPERGVVLPSEFLPVAERRGLIRGLSEFALEESCRQAREWLDRGLAFGHIAVNVCTSQVTDKDFFDAVVSRVESFDISPEVIEFEFTESLLMDSSESVSESINRLADYGFRFAIDNFGTGFASFAYLRKFNADKLKIGSDFVRNVAEKGNDAAIIKAMVGLGNSLDMQTVAEGVETEAQAAMLADFGCDQVQGFLFAKPLSAVDIVSLLQAGPLSR